MVKCLLRLFFLYFLCSITLYTQTDLFDLYELSCWRNGLPEHIQKDIIGYYNTCICIDAIPEQVDCLEFIDRATVKVLARKGTCAYSIRLHERYYQLDLLESADFQEHIPVASSHFTSIFDRYFDVRDKHMVIALTSLLCKRSKGSFVRGFILKQHPNPIRQTQWYLYRLIEYIGGDGRYTNDDSNVIELKPVLLDGVPEVCFVATAVDNNVHIFKRKGDYFEYFLCLPHPTGVISAAFSPDNTRIVTACKDNTLRVWSLLSASASKLVTLEQLLLFKLLYTAYCYEGSWDLDNLAQRLRVPLAKNLTDQTHAGIVTYLSSVFKTLNAKSQYELNLWCQLIVKQLKKQTRCVIC